MYLTNLLPFDIFYELFKIMSHLNASYLQRFFSLSPIFSGIFVFLVARSIKVFTIWSQSFHMLIEIHSHASWRRSWGALWFLVLSWADCFPGMLQATSWDFFSLLPFLSFYTFLEAKLLFHIHFSFAREHLQVIFMKGVRKILFCAFVLLSPHLNKIWLVIEV